MSRENLRAQSSFIFIILFVCVAIFSQTTQAADTLPSYTMDVTQISLGSVCTTLMITPNSNPCNPAFAGLQKRTFFLGNIFLGDNYSTVRDLRLMAEEQRFQELIERIYLENRVIHMQSATTLYFISPHFNVTLSPERLFFASRTYNPSYPTYEIQIVREQSLAFQYGFHLNHEWAWGLQTRLVSRDYHLGNFSLFDAVAENNGLFVSDQQQAIFFEPGFTYISEHPWHPRWSLFVSNTGLNNKKGAGIEMNPILESGIGFETPITYLGRFEFGLTYRWTDNPFFLDDDPWRVGGIYEFGLVNASFAWGEYRRSLGVVSSFNNFRVGLLYESRRTITNRGIDTYEDLVSTEFGLLL
jgi:hypothetical protein